MQLRPGLRVHGWDCRLWAQGKPKRWQHRPMGRIPGRHWGVPDAVAAAIASRCRVTVTIAAAVASRCPGSEQSTVAGLIAGLVDGLRLFDGLVGWGMFAGLSLSRRCAKAASL